MKHFLLMFFALCSCALAQSQPRASSFNPAAPGAIGATTSSSGAFTTLSASGQVLFTGPNVAINSTGRITLTGNGSGFVTVDTASTSGNQAFAVGRGDAGKISLFYGTAASPFNSEFFQFDVPTAITKLPLGGVISSGPVRLKGYTVATLPVGTQGDTAFVSDALAPAFLAAVVGGGAVKTIVFYDGTNWVSN